MTMRNIKYHKLSSAENDLLLFFSWAPLLNYEMSSQLGKATT